MLNDLINIDLHIHSIASLYKEKSEHVKNSNAENCDVLLNALTSAPHNIRLFSITDHNRFDPALYDAFYKRIDEGNYDISLLPGVEFDVSFDSSKPDVHVITIFDARTASDRQKIADAISNDELTEPEDYYNLSRYGSILCAINLPTILIAHQHTGLGAPHPKDRSMTAGTEDALSYYEFGYIDALEFTTPKVEAILKSELRALSLPASMLAGSDCHDWASYPKHDGDSKTKAPSAYFMRLRALPTFKGLLLALTSPMTRIGSQRYSDWQGYLSSIRICGKEVELSPGINAIIGENGVGKSSLLALLTQNNPRESHIKAIKKAFSIEVPRPVNTEDLISIEQGQLQADYRDNKMFDRTLYLDVDHEAFETEVKRFSLSLKKAVKANIDREGKRQHCLSSVFHIDTSKEEGETHYIRTKVENGFSDVQDQYKPSQIVLSGISRKLALELEKSEVYEASEMEKLRSAKMLIDEVEQKIRDRSLDKQAESKARSYVQELLEEYEAKISQASSTFDNDLASYRESRTEFISSIEELARLEAMEPDGPISKITPTQDWGVSRNIAGGFNFVMAAHYAETQDITQDFLKSMFNSDYQSQAIIESISDEATAIRALSGVTSGNWETAWDEKLSKFLASEKICKPSILDLENNGIGDTLGEEALTFYKYKTSSIWREGTHRVFIIDQPEDNISNARIAADLTDYFNRLRGKAQIIMVTHNPLLVVNQDVDNVIVMQKKKGEPLVTAGCLESESDSENEVAVLDLVAEIMDGGREAIKRRLKIYGQENPCDRINRQ